MAQTGDDVGSGHTISVEEILARLRAGIDARNGIGTTRETQLETEPARRPRRGFSEDVYRSLHHAKLMSGNVHVDYKVGYRTPIIGQAWALVRRRIHQEIRIYIDALMRQQTNFNNYLVRALSGLIENLDACELRARLEAQETYQRQITELRAQVAALEERLRKLEQRSSDSPGTQ